MQFDILSIFPESFQSYFHSSILRRAQDSGCITIQTHDVRRFTTDRHHKVDDTPYGGGAGMVMKVEPFDRALASLGVQPGMEQTRIILLSAKGRPFDQATARRLARCDQIVLLAGRYEGVDERVHEHLVDEELSIGPYVLTGGELPAMVVVDAVARLIPGVLGNETSALRESYTESDQVEYPQYTKPERYREWSVPPVLLSGNHADIEAWRTTESQHQSTQQHDQKETRNPVEK